MKSYLKQGFVFSLLFLLVGCFDDDDKAQTPTPEAKTIVDVAVENGSFTTLVAALQATGLDATLDDENATFTVFAPTDDAFALLGETTINALLADPDTLSSILKYHVIGTRVDSTSAVASAGTTVQTVNGQKIALSLAGDSLLVNTSTVTVTDVMADNGIIHVIDAVLLPPETTTSEANIVNTAVNAGNFSTLVKALQTTGLDDVLADETKSFTVFAPTDDAFAVLGNKLINTLLANPDVLANILKQHVVEGAIDSVTAMSQNGKSVTTLFDNTVGVSIEPATNQLQFGGANIITKDIVTTNGIIHVIDAVVVGDIALPTSYGTLADVASDAGSFTTLLSALQVTGLDTLISSPTKTFTVFAPTDAAFAALGQATLDALIADPDTLRNILLYHVISDAKVLSDGASTIAGSNENKVTMANNQQAALSLNQGSLFINDSAISAANVLADNGVIHVLDKVILPPKAVGTPSQTIAEVAQQTASLSTLVSALQSAGLVDTFADETANFTVFAPTNAAFEKIPAATLSALLADNSALTGVLQQHVLTGQVSSLDAFAANGKSVETLRGNSLSVQIVNFAKANNRDTDLIAYDATNRRLVTGKGHSDAGKTVYVFNADLSAQTSQCNDTCAQNWPPVLLADGKTVDNIPGLSTITRADNTTQLTYLGRPLYTYVQDTAAGDANGENVNSSWFSVKLAPSQLQIGGVNVTSTDIYTTNGVVHLIDTVIVEAK